MDNNNIFLQLEQCLLCSATTILFIAPWHVKSSVCSSAHCKLPEEKNSKKEKLFLSFELRSPFLNFFVMCEVHGFRRNLTVFYSVYEDQFNIIIEQSKNKLDKQIKKNTADSRRKNLACARIFDLNHLINSIIGSNWFFFLLLTNFQQVFFLVFSFLQEVFFEFHQSFFLFLQPHITYLNNNHINWWAINSPYISYYFQMFFVFSFFVLDKTVSTSLLLFYFSHSWYYLSNQSEKHFWFSEISNEITASFSINLFLV